MKKNLRTSHFTLGQAPSLYDTVNGSYGGFKQPQVGSNDNSDMKKQLLASKIEMGDKKVGTAYFNTTYNLFNGPKKIETTAPSN